MTYEFKVEWQVGSVESVIILSIFVYNFKTFSNVCRPDSLKSFVVFENGFG